MIAWMLLVFTSSLLREAGGHLGGYFRTSVAVLAVVFLLTVAARSYRCPNTRYYCRYCYFPQVGRCWSRYLFSHGQRGAVSCTHLPPLDVCDSVLRFRDDIDIVV